MNRFAVSVVMGLSLLCCGFANAATCGLKQMPNTPVQICLRPLPSHAWVLEVTNISSMGVGAVNLLTTGLTTLTVNALNTAISALDSSISIDPLAIGLDSVIVANVAGQTIVFNTGIATLLATLTGPGPVTLQGFENPDVGGIGAYTTAGVAYDAADLSYTVPEPGALLLLGLGAAALAFVRRAA